MIEMEGLASKIFSLLKGNGFLIKIFDDQGAETTDPESGTRFFILDPNIMVTIDPEENSVEFSKGNGVDDSIIMPIQKNIRKLVDEFLMNCTTKVFGKSIQPRDYSYQVKKDQPVMEKNSVLENEFGTINSHLLGKVLNKVGYSANSTANTIADELGADLAQVQRVLNKLVTDGKVTAAPGQGGAVYAKAMDETVLSEGFSRMFGSAKTSRQTLENVRILVRHNKPVDESVRGSRSRHINAIFLECNGERFRLPFNNLQGARAMAQHIAHGGNAFDKIAEHISENVANLGKLQSFARYATTNNLINESSSRIIEVVKESIHNIKEELKRLSGTKTYETVKARIETFDKVALSESDTDELKELFTVKRFDEQFDEVLPIVKQLVSESDMYLKRIEEAAGNSVVVRRGIVKSTPMFEFASEHAKLGFGLNEFALRIQENEELASFIGKVGTKLCKEGKVNEFERAVIEQVFENIKIAELEAPKAKELKESRDLESFFDKFDYTFLK